MQLHCQLQVALQVCAYTQIDPLVRASHLGAQSLQPSFNAGLHTAYKTMFECPAGPAFQHHDQSAGCAGGLSRLARL